MKLGTEYLGMSKLLKHAIKSFLDDFFILSTFWRRYYSPAFCRSCRRI